MQSLLLKFAAQLDEARQSVGAYAQVQERLDEISQINHELFVAANLWLPTPHERTGSVLGLRHQSLRLEPSDARGARTLGPSPSSPPAPYC